MTLRESLGGPWGTHWVIWAGLFVPTLLLVVLHESITGYPAWWWSLASGVLQHLAVGVIVIGGGHLARRRSAVLSIAVVATLWITASISRALIGGFLAATVADADPQYLWRSGVWLLGTVVWIPVLVYTAAQFDRRRVLLGALDETTLAMENHRQAAGKSGADVRRSLTLAIRESLEPALKDLVTSLEVSRERLSATAIAELSMRVSELHDRTADLLEPPAAPSTRVVAPRATLRRAFDLPPRFPWLIAGLTAIATTVALLPDVWRVFGNRAALELTASVGVAAVVIGLVPWLALRFASQRGIVRDQRITVFACAVGIGVAIYLMLNSGIDPTTLNGLAVVPLLTITLAVACAIYVGAIALSDANDEASDQLDISSLRSQRESDDHDALVDRERRRLADLMHGPVQGRLAACVMALNFSATSARAVVDDEGSFDALSVDSALVDSILNHLKAVSRDLSSIAASDAPPAP